VEIKVLNRYKICDGGDKGPEQIQNM
jgi:hypothetical protein